MTSWINNKKILSKKISGILVSSSTPVCLFTNPDAQTYWNALTVANGGIEVNGSIYGITTCSLKIAIDDWFNNIQALGIYGTFKAVYPYIGANSATHAVNAVNPGTFDLTFFGGPISNSTGTVFNGINQYANTGLVPTIDLTLYDEQITSYTISQTIPSFGSSIFMGARTSLSVGNNRIELSLASTGTLRGTMYNTSSFSCQAPSNINYTAAAPSEFYMLSRDTNSSMNLWKSGVSVGSTLGLCCGVHPAFSIYIGAMNTAGVPQNFSNGATGFNAIGSSINGGNAANYTTITKTLMATLGR
jgi:hypothetical protein